jgi:hypothetical protein
MTQPQALQSPRQVIAARARFMEDNAEAISETAKRLYEDRFNLQGIKPSTIYAWAEDLANAARNMENLARHAEGREGTEAGE